MINLQKIFWFIGITVLILIIFLPGYSKLQELKDKNKVLEVKIKEVKKENANLENEILRLQQDPLYQEEVLRDRLGVVRKGEVVYKIEKE